MRVAFFVWFVFFVCVSFNILNAQEISRSDLLYKNVKSDTFVPLFRAFKNGDVDAIKEYISDDVYEKNKVLLEQNKEYPNFLRNFYRDAIFQVRKIVKSEEMVFVDTRVRFPDGYQGVTKVQLKEGKSKTGDTIWKVINFVDNSQ
ncbi:hypothetical protein KSMBR1_0519 [Candidatus Kuenenia stuttgartiensis]|uniref:Uncharacterized protein n=1 Tax=Kuenenia stuttgartiensis TaxID=174633 RepID=A0A2C9CBT1_KUEST|nr:hypothetical protein KSMBR1_0519 [Candidatus Kuenenia stuttgartiensis]